MLWFIRVREKEQKRVGRMTECWESVSVYRRQDLVRITNFKRRAFSQRRGSLKAFSQEI